MGRALLAALVPGELRDEIAGDLTERFARRARADGRLRAHLWYWGQIVRMRPLALRRAAAEERRRRAATPYQVSKMWMWTGWSADVRQAVRGLRARIGFSATVTLTVALATGASTSVFSVVNGVLLRPLDYPEPDRLVRAWQTRPSWMDHPNPQLRAIGARSLVSVPTFNDWASARTGLESLGIYRSGQWVHESGEGTELLRGLTLTSGVFEALGVEPHLGRRLVPPDDEVGAPSVAVLSHAIWRDRFGGDRALLGRTISLDGTPHVVVGVMPAGFTVPGAGGGLWASLPDSEKLRERDSQSYTVLARLRDGATVESALADLEAIQARLSELYPDAQADMGARVDGLLDSMVGGVRSTLLFLFAAVGLVLLIACVNIANMLSVHGLARRRELAVKKALGCSKARLVRGLLTESAVLAGLGSLGGIALSILTLPMLTRALPPSLPRADDIGIDARVLAFGLLVTAVTALVAGALPALQAWATHPKQTMDATSRGLAGGRLGERARSTLVVMEVATAFVLLVGATLLATSFSRLWNVERGFTSEGLIAMEIEPNPVDFPEQEDRVRFRSELRDGLAAIPGVRVTNTNQIPLSGSTASRSYYLDRPDGRQERLVAVISRVGEDYFDVMEIALLEGRAFEPADHEVGPLVGVVNRTLADRYWAGETAVGKVLRADADDPPTTIIGVAADVRHQGLHEPAEPKLYVPIGQIPDDADQWLLRVQGDAAGAMQLARAAVADVSRSTPVSNVELLEERIARSVAVPRFRTYFVVGLAGLATVLALLGVYGVVAFAVSQRTRELAVRMAIGAQPREVIAATLSRGGRLALGGVTLGVLVAWQGTRAIEEFLFEVDAGDPWVYGLVAGLVGGVSLLASFLPARRASRVDPVSILNSE